MKKALLRIVYVLLILVGVFAAYAVVTGKTYLFKAVWYNFANIDDYKIFPNNTVVTGTPDPWPVATRYNTQKLPADFEKMMEELQTVSLLAVQNDSIIFEAYWDGYSDSSLSGSFSMAKSIISLLVGAALKEGSIRSLDEPVGNYIDAFKEGAKAKVKIVDLLTMSSGTNWDEAYANPFSVTTELYYGNDAPKTALKVKMIKEPGTYHDYKSGDTELLAMILEKATGKSMSAYASEKIWKPIGAVYPALWSIDHTGGIEKAYCCFNSNARDFARLGQLMLDSGRWKGNEIITPEYFSASITPCMIKDDSGQPCNYYGYQWWIYPGREQIFYARGILGQYIIVIPSRKMVLVRLGKTRSKERVNGAPAEIDAIIKWGMGL